MLNTYRITVEKLDGSGHTVRQSEIVCTSDFTLVDDLADWVKEEIDADASVVISEPLPVSEPLFPLIDPDKCQVTKSAHTRRAGYKDGNAIEFCEECKQILRVVSNG